MDFLKTDIEDRGIDILAEEDDEFSEDILPPPPAIEFPDEIVENQIDVEPFIEDNDLLQKSCSSSPLPICVTVVEDDEDDDEEEDQRDFCRRRNGRFHSERSECDKVTSISTTRHVLPDSVTAVKESNSNIRVHTTSIDTNIARKHSSSVSTTAAASWQSSSDTLYNSIMHTQMLHQQHHLQFQQQLQHQLQQQQVQQQLHQQLQLQQHLQQRQQFRPDQLLLFLQQLNQEQQQQHLLETQRQATIFYNEQLFQTMYASSISHPFYPTNVLSPSSVVHNGTAGSFILPCVPQMWNHANSPSTTFSQRSIPNVPPSHSFVAATASVVADAKNNQKRAYLVDVSLADRSTKAKLSSVNMNDVDSRKRSFVDANLNSHHEVPEDCKIHNIKVTEAEDEHRLLTFIKERKLDDFEQMPEDFRSSQNRASVRVCPPQVTTPPPARPYQPPLELEDNSSPKEKLLSKDDLRFARLSCVARSVNKADLLRLARIVQYNVEDWHINIFSNDVWIIEFADWMLASRFKDMFNGQHVHNQPIAVDLTSGM